mmetsp:Transcript_25472/g.38636  ORF Transcript_25472/g.38636 Transcript_25472/m.38636 type:complete len:127 (+) Transcript_25472:168-548(+)
MSVLELPSSASMTDPLFSASSMLVGISDRDGAAVGDLERESKRLCQLISIRVTEFEVTFSADIEGNAEGWFDFMKIGDIVDICIEGKTERGFDLMRVGEPVGIIVVAVIGESERDDNVEGWLDIVK